MQLTIAAVIGLTTQMFVHALRAVDSEWKLDMEYSDFPSLEEVLEDENEVGHDIRLCVRMPNKSNNRLEFHVSMEKQTTDRSISYYWTYSMNVYTDNVDASCTTIVEGTTFEESKLPAISEELYEFLLDQRSAAAA